jgi:RNA polymerase sigma-70 factor (ECF subfamily)
MPPISSTSVAQDQPRARSAAAPVDAALEVHRRELTGYCYRMLGGGAEAEDAAQETLVRAWRSLDRFEGRSTLRSWLYRIATNVCIDMHRSPQRRARPMEMGPSTAVVDVVLGDALPEHAFVEPMADHKTIDLHGDPADVATARESVRMAFVAALQLLPARQRAALILCEVLRWEATEVAELLETTTASVNSALQRARATLADHRGEPLDPLHDPQHQELLRRYVAAFERYDVDEIVTLLRDDVVLSMPPFPVWLTGPSELASWFLGPGIGCTGSRLVPVEICGTAGFGSYRSAGPGRWEPFAIQLIEVRDGAIVGHHNFLYPHWFTEFGLPAYLEA